MNKWLALAMVWVGCGSNSPEAFDEPVQPGCEPLGARAFQQFPIFASEGDTDFALDGPGFFALRNGETDVFTRDGHFTLDAEGFFVGRGGYRLQGFSQQSPTAGDLQVGPVTAAPEKTSSIIIRANLDAAEPVVASPFDVRDPSACTAFATTVMAYDSLGTPMTIDVYWQHTNPGSWAFHALTDGVNVSGGTLGESFEIASGTLGFDDQGRRVSLSQTSAFLPINASEPQAITFELSGVTQFAGSGTTTFVSQNGSPYGLLEHLQLDFGGSVIGVYSNGQTLALGRIAVAVFPVPTALRPISGRLVLATPASGKPTLAASGVGGRGDIVANALEQLPDEATRCVR